MGKGNHKSIAKASGLKSTFINGSEVTMTSFGKGNSAVLEKRIIDSEVEDLNPDRAFTIEENDVQKGKLRIKSKRMRDSATADNPIHSSPEKSDVTFKGRDIIGCKDVLEQRYFGQTFDDNIHIQLIYNILDIEKILAVHVTNAAFALNNIMRIEDTETDDFIGYLSSCNTYDSFRNYESDTMLGVNAKANLKKSNEFFDNIKKDTRLGYFGPAFYEKKGKNFVRKPDKSIYHVLAIVGNLRQFVVHDTTTITGKARSRSWLYNIDKQISPEFIQTMIDMYNAAVQNIDRDFVETNKVDIRIIHDAFYLIYGSADWQKIVEEYYRFTIEKSYKNIGFSVKKLREEIISTYATKFENHRYDSVRHKLNKIIDFLIFTSYSNDDICQKVSVLRTCMNDEEKEERFYKPEAKIIWDKFRDIFNEFIPEHINGKAVSDLKKAPFNHREINIDSLKISRKNSDSFSKIIYLLTMFLDGKEINDLLTTLINKFDNISSFISIMKEMNISCDFTDEYRFFNKSKYICSELRLINSFARMTSPVSLAKREMYREAVEILGTAGMTEDEKESLLDKVLCIDENGKYVSSKDNRNRDVNLRNFIANNVIESSRFKYLIRYNNAKKTRVLASNKTVVRFLLERIDKLNEKQIDRYYETCSSDKTLKNKKDKIDFLADLIMKIDCSQFMKVKNRVKAGTAEALEKERLKAVVGLYLTIMYIITKNMVYVNSRYVTAFHCLERDRVLLIAEKGDLCALTRMFVAPENGEKYALGRNKRASSYIEHNCDSITKDFLINYRNAVAHLSVVRNMESYIGDIKYVENYFALYHYTMQRWLLDQKAVTDQSPVFLKKYNNNLDEYHTYCKDFVKALNVPFGYNLARYKNLSIAELFDMNDMETESSVKFGNEVIPVE